MHISKKVLVLVATVLCNTCFASAATITRAEDVAQEDLFTSGVNHREIQYDWKVDTGATCTLVFTNYVRSNAWELYVPVRANFLVGTSWKDDVCTINGDDFLELLKATLEDYRTRDTSGSLRTISIGFHLIPDLWEPFLPKLRDKLEPLPATAQPSWALLGKFADEAMQGNPYLMNLKSTIEQAGYEIERGPFHSGEKAPGFKLDVNWDKTLEEPLLGLVTPGNVTVHVKQVKE